MHTSDWLAAAVVVVGVLVAVAGALVASLAALGAYLVWKRRRPDPAARARALEELGYREKSAGPSGQVWVRGIEGASVDFEDRPKSWRWTVRLPRYNTMSLAIEERSAVDPGSMAGAFETRNAELDRRFLFASGLAAQAIHLATNRAVGSALLGMPFLSLRLGADELVIEDVGLQTLVRAGSPTAGTPRAVAAEVAMHHAVAELVSALFRSLYTATGTIFDEHR